MVALDARNRHGESYGATVTCLLALDTNQSYTLTTIRRICEECEEHHLSRKCPLCRGEYAPMLLYPFPDLNPDTENSDRM